MINQNPHLIEMTDIKLDGLDSINSNNLETYCNTNAQKTSLL
ncbi:protein of unknown function [Candidatus Nitrosocosmicus franklandus]|uniref:Uncharacterized protein n=1 Tax=Candidatus Nitrosocosmicus franklandianus TaxID=1798806 RepID=A0A484ICC8_9ARCH|nr:protein of unknown function [Candidatus Nitrosocosmicus franklandus]